MLRGIKQISCTPRPRDPTETETELCLSVSCRGRWAVDYCRGRGSGCSRPGVAEALLEEVTINRTIQPPGLTQDWGKGLVEGTNRTLCTAEPRRKEQWPHKRLTRTCPGMSRSLQWRCGLRWPAAGSGALSAAVHAWDLLKEVAITFITSTIVWPQVRQQGGNIALPINKKLKIYWAWPHPSEQDPVSPTVSLSHQETSISLFLPVRGQTKGKPQSQKTNQTHHMDHTLV